MAKGSKKKLAHIAEPLRGLAVDIKLLNADPDNTVTHDTKSIAAIQRSLKRFGQDQPLVVQEEGMIVRKGNGRLAAAMELGWTHVAAVVVSESNLDAVARSIADNRSGEFRNWDYVKLRDMIETIKDGGSDVEVVGWDKNDLAKLVAAQEGPPEIIEDEVPEPPADPITKAGDLWQLGRHRLLCGDSTNEGDVDRLMDGATASMLHADPPYGMGKEKDGIVNDNLYRGKLDAFQMEWWRACRPSLADNGSAYIWGTAEDLWRLWYVGGLKDSERLTFRNEVVWSKGFAQQFAKMEQGSTVLRSYNLTSERCLFFMIGEQGFNNNADNYWEGFEPIRAALVVECKKMEWGQKDIERICGVGMYGHWFTKSQWTFIPEEHYMKLQEAAKGQAFKQEHDQLKQEHDQLKQEFYATRAYFDNTHDNMTDVWEFNRVSGEDRHGHATPKPVVMVARAMLSSSRADDVVLVPFGGTGPEFIAAEQLGCKCYGMEISPAYCDVIVERWENLTGSKASVIK